NEGEAKEPRDLRRITMALIVAAIVLSVAAIGYVLYTDSLAQPLDATPAIVAGDSVEMEYIGRLPDGRVFDTSNLSVALDDGLYPKSLTFQLRDNDSYKPFTMEAGKTGSGGTIPGFANGVIGLHAGDHVTIEVPVGEGYEVNQSMLRTIELEEEIYAIEVMSEDDFRNNFGFEPIQMRTYTHFFWGWDVLVVERVGGMVTLRHQPVVGQVVHPFGDPDNSDDPAGWDVVVKSYDTAANSGLGSIELEHEVVAEDVYNVKGTDADDLQFVVSGFNATAGTFEIHKIDTESGYNGELAGRTLYFEVTILDVESP
ncbi:MAG: hypothetical protein A3K67_05875, partial [Euryarchaeota archaeon RBG_16_62_10]